MKTTKERVLHLSALYQDEITASRQRAEAKKKYEEAERNYVSIRNQVDVAELELEGSNAEMPGCEANEHSGDSLVDGPVETFWWCPCGECNYHGSSKCATCGKVNKDLKDSVPSKD